MGEQVLDCSLPESYPLQMNMQRNSEEQECVCVCVCFLGKYVQGCVCVRVSVCVCVCVLGKYVQRGVCVCVCQSKSCPVIQAGIQWYDHSWLQP